MHNLPPLRDSALPPTPYSAARLYTHPQTHARASLIYLLAAPAAAAPTAAHSALCPAFQPAVWHALQQ